MTKKMRYHLYNGYHGTHTFVMVAEGEIVGGDTMRQAGRRLCGYKDCTCASSAASSPRDDDVDGVQDQPRLVLVPCAIVQGCRSDDLDDHVLVDEDLVD